MLSFIQQHAQQDDHEAYGTLNMGAGFALFVPAEQAQRTVEIAAGPRRRRHRWPAWSRPATRNC